MSYSDTLSPPPKPRLLIVDDEKTIRQILSDFLVLEGYDVDMAKDGVAALENMSESRYDLVISDLKMPRMGGLELLENVQKTYENTLVVIMTGFGTVETAIEAMKKGAYDYILKPFKIEEVVHIVGRGLEKQRLKFENIRLKEIISIHEFSEQLQTNLSLDEVVDSLLDTCVKNIRCDQVALYLNIDTDEPEIKYHAIHPDAPPGADNGVLNLKMLMDIFEEDIHVVTFKKNSALKYFEKAPDNLSALMCAPLVSRTKNLGIIAVQSITEGSAFSVGQRKYLSMLTSRVAAAIDNAILFSNMRNTFRETIQGFASAIEAMDKYTAGHSERVTVYARIIAEEMGESKENVETIMQAGMLHDIGKLGCQANLNKPGKLTEDEYEIFKKHPGFGKDIIESIHFLRPLIPGVHYHHERWDGKGYPKELKGEEIPLMARILAVADSYDAMTSSRAYRSALGKKIAITEIKRCARTQFDPNVVDAFIVALEKNEKDIEGLAEN